mmetsp:Transcript_1329/g.3410  ORF Transcript_1329/g.3410 Transcript_1329/m.3410 type:complete len:248 (-) Transcript_1329:3-746(-)
MNDGVVDKSGSNEHGLSTHARVGLRLSLRLSLRDSLRDGLRLRLRLGLRLGLHHVLLRGREISCREVHQLCFIDAEKLDQLCWQRGPHAHEHVVQILGQRLDALALDRLRVRAPATRRREGHVKILELRMQLAEVIVPMRRLSHEPRAVVRVGASLLDRDRVLPVRPAVDHARDLRGEQTRRAARLLVGDERGALGDDGGLAGARADRDPADPAGHVPLGRELSLVRRLGGGVGHRGEGETGSPPSN